MRTNRVKILILGIFAGLLVAAGSGVATANAQERAIRRPHRPPRVIIYRPARPFWPRYYDPFWDPYWGPRYNYVDPIAYQKEQGYREGRDEGKKAAKKGLAANPEGTTDYIKSNSLAYREAFIQGYNERYEEKMADLKKERSEKSDE